MAAGVGRVHRVVICICVASGLWLSPGAGAQAPVPVPPDNEIEQFLLTAKVVRSRDTRKGVTGSIRATLTDGTLTHDVHVQMVDEAKFEFRTLSGVEYNFRDSWRFNVAAYRIDRLLGLHLVPVSVERRWKAKPAAYTWWVDDVMMDEGERMKRKLESPDAACWNAHIRLVRVFDQLIDNIDRNLGNLVITNAWRIWAIDHTRAFRASATPRTPANLTHIDRATLAQLKALDQATLRRAVDRYLTSADIKAVLARRDAIVTHFESAGASVLYERPAPSAGCLPQALALQESRSDPVLH
jgi:hypothetical protein